MGLLSDNKPYTAVTANIERLTSSEYPEDDIVEIIELVEIINIRPTGPTEGARALRKKLKYGSPHNQLRALTILDALIQNGGPQLKPLYKDYNLLERLRLTATDESVNPKVQKKMKGLIHGWHRELEGVEGFEELVKLENQLPQRKRRTRPQPKYLSHDYSGSDDEGGANKGHRGSHRRGQSGQSTNEDHEGAEDEDDQYNGSGVGSSSRRVAHSRHGSRSSPFNRSRSNSYNDTSTAAKKSKHKSRPSNASPNDQSGPTRMSKSEVAKERPKIQQVLAEASTASTNLTNALKLINRDLELSTENEDATKYFERCKSLRRKVLKYIHSIESEDYLGSLIHANEELVESLRLYDDMSHPDSDSDDEDWKVERNLSKLTVSDDGSDYSGSEESDGSQPQASSIPNSSQGRRAPPPISPKPAYLRSNIQQQPEEDEENPFADSHIDETASKLLKPKW